MGSFKTFFKNIAYIGIGTIFANILSFICLPFIAKTYTPAIYGEYSFLLSIGSIISVLITLNFDRAIVVSETEEKQNNLFLLSLVSVFFLSLLSALVIYSYSYFFNIFSILNYIPIYALLLGLNSIFNNLAIHSKSFKKLTISKLIVSIVFNCSALLLVRIKTPTAHLLIISTLFSQLAGLLFLVKLKDLKFNTKISIVSLFDTFKQFKKFSFNSTTGSVLNSFSWQIPVFFLRSFFGNEILGFYSLGFRIIQMPLSLISSSVSQVYFKEIQLLKQESKIRFFLKKLITQEILLIFSPMLILLIVGDKIFASLLNNSWIISGNFAQILSPWFLVMFISTSLSNTLIVFGKSNLELYLSAFDIFIRSTAILVGSLTNNPFITVFLFSLAGICSSFLLLHFVFKLTGLKLQFVKLVFKKEIFYILGILFISIIIRTQDLNKFIIFLFLISFSIFHFLKVLRYMRSRL